MPDIVNLIIWLVAGVAGGNAAGELLKGDYDLGPGNTVAGAIGGVVGTLILQTLIPALRGIDYGPIIGQVIVAAASGAALTVIAGAVQIRRRQRRRGAIGTSKVTTLHWIHDLTVRAHAGHQGGDLALHQIVGINPVQMQSCNPVLAGHPAWIYAVRSARPQENQVHRP